MSFFKKETPPHKTYAETPLSLTKEDIKNMGYNEILSLKKVLADYSHNKSCSSWKSHLAMSFLITGSLATLLGVGSSNYSAPNERIDKSLDTHQIHTSENAANPSIITFNSEGGKGYSVWKCESGIGDTLCKIVPKKEAEQIKNAESEHFTTRYENMMAEHKSLCGAVYLSFLRPDICSKDIGNLKFKTNNVKRVSQVFAGENDTGAARRATFEMGTGPSSFGIASYVQKLDTLTEPVDYPSQTLELPQDNPPIASAIRGNSYKWPLLGMLLPLGLGFTFMSVAMSRAQIITERRTEKDVQKFKKAVDFDKPLEKFWLDYGA